MSMQIILLHFVTLVATNECSRESESKTRRELRTGFHVHRFFGAAKCRCAANKARAPAQGAASQSRIRSALMNSSFRGDKCVLHIRSPFMACCSAPGRTLRSDSRGGSCCVTRLLLSTWLSSPGNR